MKSKTTLRRANLYTSCCMSLTAFVCCVIAAHAQNASADVTRTFSVIGSSALASYADSTGTMHASTSGAVQTQVAQLNSYTPTQADVTPALPDERVHGGIATIATHSGIAAISVGALAGRPYFSVATFIRKPEPRF